MREKTFKRLEIAGGFVTFSIWLALHYLNSLESNRLINVLFGSANNSVWECEKVLLLACAFWGVIELCWVRPAFRSFVAAKAISLYVWGAAYAFVCSSLEILGVRFSPLWEAASIGLLAAAFHIFSYCLMKKCPGLHSFFVPALFLLLLFAVIYVCFTIYPPRLAAFFDFKNNLYGIIPPYFDKGAIRLDSLYGN